MGKEKEMQGKKRPPNKTEQLIQSSDKKMNKTRPEQEGQHGQQIETTTAWRRRGGVAT